MQSDGPSREEEQHFASQAEEVIFSYKHLNHYKVIESWGRQLTHIKMNVFVPWTGGRCLVF